MTRRNFIQRAGQWVPAVGLLALPRQASAAVTYFGQNVSTGGGIDNGSSGKARYNYGATGNNVTVCPGTGNQVVKELGALVQQGYVGPPTDFRLAIYSMDGTLVMQGSAKIAADQHDSPKWQTHTSFVDAAGAAIANPILVGGTSYILAGTGGGTGGGVSFYRIAASSGDSYGKEDYVGYCEGFPSSLGSGWSAEAYTYSFRCGVEPAPPTGVARRRFSAI